MVRAPRPILRPRRSSDRDAPPCRSVSSSGRLAPLPVDSTTFPLRRAAPDAFALAVGQGMLKAGLAYRALGANRLGLPGVVLVGRRVEDLGVDALASSELAPAGGRWGGHQGHFLKHSVRLSSLVKCLRPLP